MLEVESNRRRIIGLIDMDCFYVQVEQRLNPSLIGQPVAVVQYNSWKGGGVIAVSYEARKFGVNRHLRGDDAKELCPTINLVRVPEVRGKADLNRYREAGAEVIQVICRFAQSVERASVDEAYIDLTAEVDKRLKALQAGGAEQLVTVEALPSTFVVLSDGNDAPKAAPQPNDRPLSPPSSPSARPPHPQPPADPSAQLPPTQTLTDDQILVHNSQLEREENRLKQLSLWVNELNRGADLDEVRLAIGAVMVEEIRRAIVNETQFKCSAGVAHNKMLAKLTCGVNKPNRQTVLPWRSIDQLFAKTPIRSVRSLGGKLGAALEELGLRVMADLQQVSGEVLTIHFGLKTAQYLQALSHGVEDEPVVERQLPKSIGCGKNFPGRQCLATRGQVLHWSQQLTLELSERLLRDRQAYGRVARLLTVSVRLDLDPPVSSSRSCPITNYDAGKLATDAFAVLRQFNQMPPTGGSDAQWMPPLLGMAMAASKFADAAGEPPADAQQASLLTFFRPTSSGSDAAPDTQGRHQPNAPVAAQQQQVPTEQPASPDTNVAPAQTNSAAQSAQPDAVVRARAAKRSAAASLDSWMTKSQSIAAAQPQAAEDDAAKRLRTCTSPPTVNTSDCDETAIKPKATASSPIAGSSSLAAAAEEGSSRGATMDEEHVICDKCGAKVALTELWEHDDYHVALELQKERPPPQGLSGKLVGAKSQPVASTSAVSDRAKSSKSVKSSQQLSIRQFFQP